MTDDAYLDAASAMVGLPVAEAWRPGVLRFLGIAAEMAAILERVPLDDGLNDLAPVYQPPEVPR